MNTDSCEIQHVGDIIVCKSCYVDVWHLSVTPTSLIS